MVMRLKFHDEAFKLTAQAVRAINPTAADMYASDDALERFMRFIAEDYMHERSSSVATLGFVVYGVPVHNEPDTIWVSAAVYPHTVLSKLGIKANH
jgi:hypothetical protein